MVQRPMDHFIKTDIDPKGRGYVTKTDAKDWPSPILLDDAEFVWPWKEGKDHLTYADIEKYLRESTKIDTILLKCKDSPFYGAFCDRPDIYSETASIKSPIYIYTGELDLQTPVSEAKALKEACDKEGKKIVTSILFQMLVMAFPRPVDQENTPWQISQLDQLTRKLFLN